MTANAILAGQEKLRTASAPASAPALDPCEQAKKWEQESDAKQRAKLLRKFFRCLWNRTDALEAQEERTVWPREELAIQKKYLLKKDRNADTSDLDNQIKAADDVLGGIRAELADVAAVRAQLVDSQPDPLLRLQREELDAKLADLNGQIDSGEAAKTMLEKRRGELAHSSAAQKESFQFQLEGMGFQLVRLRAKRTNYTKEFFRVREKLGERSPGK